MIYVKIKNKLSTIQQGFKVDQERLIKLSHEYIYGILSLTP
jgi:hypothetical protein